MIEQIAYNVYILLGVFIILPMALFCMFALTYVTFKEILQVYKDENKEKENE